MWVHMQLDALSEVQLDGLEFRVAEVDCLAQRFDLGASSAHVLL